MRLFLAFLPKPPSHKFPLKAKLGKPDDLFLSPYHVFLDWSFPFRLQPSDLILVSLLFATRLYVISRLDRNLLEGLRLAYVLSTSKLRLPIRSLKALPLRGILSDDLTSNSQ